MAIDKAYTLTMGGKIWALDCPKAEYTGSATIEPNVYNSFGVVNGTLTITKGEEKPNVMNMYVVRFTSGEECALEFVGWDLKWAGGNAPIIATDTTYEITIVDNLATYIQS